MKKKKTNTKLVPQIKEGSIPEIGENIISRTELDQTIMIINLDVEGYIYTIDGLAAGVWGLIDGKRSVHEIKEFLVKKQGLPLSILDREVPAFILKLMKQKLVSLKTKEKPVSPKKVEIKAKKKTTLKPKYIFGGVKKEKMSVVSVRAGYQ